MGYTAELLFPSQAAFGGHHERRDQECDTSPVPHRVKSNAPAEVQGRTSSSLAWDWAKFVFPICLLGMLNRNADE